MDFSKTVDLDLYRRGIEGISGESSQLDSRRYAVQMLKAIEDSRAHVRPGMQIDHDLYGRGDSRVLETIEEASWRL